MASIKHFLNQVSLFLTASMLSLPLAAVANPDPLVEVQLQSAGATLGRDKTGKVILVGSNGATGIPLSGNFISQPNNPQGQALNFLQAYKSLFGIDDPTTQLAVKKSMTFDGRPTVKYQQLYKGVPVLSGELNVTLDAGSNLVSISGKTAPSLTLSTTAKMTAAQAQETALTVVKKEYNLDASSVKNSAPVLTIYVPELISPYTGKPKLVWRVDVGTNSIAPIQEIVLVDAEVPNKVVLHWNNSPDAQVRQTYTDNHGTNLPGSLVCNEANPTCSNGDNDAKKAHDYAGDTYKFYFNNFGRDGINGSGLTMKSTVHYGNNYQNAFWNGSQMVYGDGLSVADDVVGHELTHGVTQYTSNLNYYYQSGAINESLSDIFGEFIDLTNGKGNDSAAVRWQLGEDIPVAVFGGPIRDMKNPPLHQQPDKMTSSYYQLASDDSGGVHTNSGIGNKAAYLMTDGGTFNGKTIAGIGIPKVAKIYYRVQTTLLTSGSDYFDLYTYLNQSCRSLIGTAGITANDCTQVQNATLAVQMNGEPSVGYQPQAEVCPVDKNPSNVFFDKMEASNNWQFLNLVSSNPWLYYTDPDHPYDKKSLAVDDVSGGPTDSVAVMKTGVTIPSGAFLHFKHAFQMEKKYDGGVVEYSINNGNWTDAKPLFAAGQNYGGTISTLYGNPLAGRSAFTGTYAAENYVSTRYNLASLAGKVVRFRFREANDRSIGGFGWVIDNVRIYTCH